MPKNTEFSATDSTYDLQPLRLHQPGLNPEIYPGATIPADALGQPASSLRVLHILEATLGGTRRYLEDIAATTSEAPFAQGMLYGISRSDAAFVAMLEKARQAGWFLCSVDRMRRPMNLRDDVYAIQRVRSGICDFRPTVLHVHSAKAGGIGRLAALTRKQRPRIVYSPHALPTRFGRGFMALERTLAAVTDRFVAVSESERNEIIGQGIANRDQIDVVYPRIDTRHYYPYERAAARRGLSIEQHVPLIVGLGRLVRQKNPLNFVSTVARMRRVVPSVRAIWVGDGDLRCEVEEAVGRLQLETAFTITGWVNDVRPYIAAASVVLSTSDYESFGYCVAEAFAMGRAVVASRVTGTVDVFFPAADPFLFPAEAPELAVVLLERLLEDAALRDDIGHLARLSVMERFSDIAMYTALFTSYRKALDR